jgi:hypothetical protein
MTEIDKWISTLAGLLNPMYPASVIPALKILRPHLQTFNHVAFTPDTARQIAAAERFGPIPDWKVISPILQKAVKDARPINAGYLPAPRIPDREEPSPEQLQHVERCMQRIREHYTEQPQQKLAPYPTKPLTDHQLAEVRKRANIPHHAANQAMTTGEYRQKHEAGLA